MDEALALFAARLATRERSRPGQLSSQSLQDAWAQFQKDWERAIIYENFLLDLTAQINERCPQLEFIDTHVKNGTKVSDSLGRDVTLFQVNWNGYWDSPLVVGPNIQYPVSPICDHALTTQAFLERLPRHLDAIADKFVQFITTHKWTAYARLEIPAGCASDARWCAPLRLIRSYVVDHDVFIARFDMLGGTSEGK